MCRVQPVFSDSERAKRDRGTTIALMVICVGPVLPLPVLMFSTPSVTHFAP